MPAASIASGIAMPELLRAALEEGGIQDLDRWWREDLDDEERRQVLVLWQECGDAYFDIGRAGDLPMEMRVRGRPQREEVETYDGFWNQHLYDYLVNHEAYHFEEEMVHVCTAEVAARKAIESGILPAEFKCGISAESRPIRRRVEDAGGRSIRLSLTFVPKKGVVQPGCEP